MPDCPQPGSICGINTWAGNEVSEWPVVRGLYHEAEVIAPVPTISTSNASAEVSIWAGLGGDNKYVTSPAVLVQDGVVSYISGGQEHSVVWWEVVPDFVEQDIIGLTVHTGDNIDAFTTSNLNNDDYDDFIITDLSTNTTFSCSLNTTGGTSNNTCLPAGQSGNRSWSSDSASGECIVERPSINNNPVPLAEFNPPGHVEPIDDCWIEGEAIGPKNHHDDKMVDSNKQVLAACGAIVGGGLSFPVTWYHAT